MKSKSGFFAVDTEAWEAVSETGSINNAVAFLVLCRGTGRDNTTTSWSVNSIEKHTKMSRGRATTAITNLVKYGFVEKVKGGTKPRYKVESPARKKGKLVCANTIWLPNEIIDGTKAGEKSPVARLRQTSDVMILQLFIDLYKQQNLIEDGGILRNTCYVKYEKGLLGEFGQYHLLYFKRENYVVTWNGVKHHMRDEEDLTDEELSSGANKGIDFFERFAALEALGLVQCVPHLFESDSEESEILHPLGDCETLERKVTKAAEQAVIRMHEAIDADSNLPVNDGYLFVPVPRHLKKAHVIGIWRLRYRPQTKMTGAWWADLNNSTNRYVEQYSEMAADLISIDSQEELAT